ncbi:hypothetical protein [Candidatus Chlorohelix sp.]|uniref:hypothetical protein n=1 Tax=Candidatus Chlorohelix sp. TaxID=3139201 RepID=UPI003038B4D9
MKKTASLFPALLLTLLLVACGAATATPAPDTTTIANRVVTSAPYTTKAPLTIAPTPVSQPFTELECINVASVAGFNKLEYNTYSCIEGLLLGVNTTPQKSGGIPYLPEVGLVLTYYSGFEIGIEAVILAKDLGKFDINTLKALSGKKTRVRGAVNNYIRPGVTLYIRGVLLEEPDQFQDLSNQP